MEPNGKKYSVDKPIIGERQENEMEAGNTRG
jgi:hypothetical protein